MYDKFMFPLTVNLIKVVRNEQQLCFKEEVIPEPGSSHEKKMSGRKIEEKLLRAEGTGSRGTESTREKV